MTDAKLTERPYMDWPKGWWLSSGKECCVICHKRFRPGERQWCSGHMGYVLCEECSRKENSKT